MNRRSDTFSVRLLGKDFPLIQFALDDLCPLHIHRVEGVLGPISALSKHLVNAVCLLNLQSKLVHIFILVDKFMLSLWFIAVLRIGLNLLGIRINMV